MTLYFKKKLVCRQQSSTTHKVHRDWYVGSLFVANQWYLPL